MADFNFIVIPELRQGLESDYRELRACLEAKAWKAVHVLAGSIVEAILIDALARSGVQQSKLDNMVLATLVDLAKAKGILQEEVVDLSTVIRKYRNLIHPGRVKRLEKIVDGNGAVVAAEVVEIIAKQVAKRKQETYGFTAEQLLERLRGGASALPLVTHLLSVTPKNEIVRLLIDVLPAAYFQSLSDTSATGEQIGHLRICHRRVFEATEESVKKKVTKHLYNVYRTKPEAVVLVYEDCFFRGSDLRHLSESERRLIKAHCLARVSAKTLGDHFHGLVGIGPFLDANEAANLADIMIGETHTDDALAKRARLRLVAEYSTMKDEARNIVRLVAEGTEDSALKAALAKRESKIKPSP